MSSSVVQAETELLPLVNGSSLNSCGIQQNNKMILQEHSWALRITVTDLQVERTIRVKSDLHIGGVMIKLVDELGKKIEVS